MSKARTLADTVSTGSAVSATANDLSGGVTGSIPYQADVGDTAMLSPGTSGQVLTSGGSGAAPSWSTPRGGSWIYLSVTASSSSTVDIETTFDSTYDTYVIVASDVKVSVDSDILGMRLKIGGVYLSGANYSAFTVNSSSTGATVVGVNDFGNTRVRLVNGQGSDVGEVSNFTIYFGPTSGTTNYKQFYWTGTYTASNGSPRMTHGSGAVAGDTGALTGVRFLTDSGNIASGTFRLYGIKKN